MLGDVKLAATPELKEGLLLDNKYVTLELVRSATGKPPVVVTAACRDYLSKNDKITYFNVRPPKDLEPLIAPFIEDYTPGQDVGLHRLVVAASRRKIKKGYEVHHLDHNHLDNRSKNLKPVPAEVHRAYHLEQARLEQPRLFAQDLKGLYLRVTLKALREGEQAATALDPFQGEAVPGRGRERGPSPSGECNVDHLGASDQSSLEPPFQLPAEAYGLVTHNAPTLEARQLKALGLPARSAERAANVLRFVARQEGLTRASAIQARFCPKNCSRSTLQETLRDLVSRGLLIHQAHRYGLTRLALKFDDQSQPDDHHQLGSVMGLFS